MLYSKNNYYGLHVTQDFLIRPIAMTDAANLLKLVKRSSGGLSSLQPRLEFLQDYIAKSEASFAGELTLETPHKYLMVLTPLQSDKIIGCSAVKTQIGKDTPFINFDIKGDGLDQFLEASSRFTGATEVGSLFLDPDYRKFGLGRYLASVRYLLMASEPWRFGETVIAELRGICGAEGSPLYDYLFEDKLEKSFLEADNEYFDRNPDALGDIVPIGRIATSPMPLDVRASIAQPHPSGNGAMRLLQSEGFIFSGTIDLFDAGPIMSAYRDTIRTGLNSKLGPVSISGHKENSYPALVTAGDVKDFRAVVTQLPDGDTPILSPAAAEALQVNEGDTVRYWIRSKKR